MVSGTRCRRRWTPSFTVGSIKRSIEPSLASLLFAPKPRRSNGVLDRVFGVLERGRPENHDELEDPLGRARNAPAVTHVHEHQ